MRKKEKANLESATEMAPRAGNPTLENAMILTIKELQQQIAGLPPETPIRIECAKTWFEEGPGGCCAEQTETDYATEVRFEGNHVLIGCD